MSCTLFVYQQVSFQSIKFNQIQYKETIKSNYEFIYILKNGYPKITVYFGGR